jgi:hypothetical protein
MGRRVYQADQGEMRRECFLPWWWPLYTLWLRIEAAVTGRPTDPERVERAHCMHARWRIVPKHYL